MKMKFVVLALAIFPLTICASNYGSVTLDKEDILTVVDGQAFKANIKQWQPVIGQNIEVRLRYLIAPKFDGVCEQEAVLASDSKNFVQKLLVSAESIVLKDIQRDTTGFRLVADVTVDGADLGSALIDADLAYRADETAESPWCDVRVSDLSYDNGVYSGEILDGIPSGTGNWISNDGRQEYIGEWQEGLWHGEGTHKASDGSTNSGEYQLGQRNGQSSWGHPDGRKYVGEYRYNKMHGQGVHTFANGDVYSGMFEDGRQHGKGVYTFSDGSVVAGDWKGGKPWYAQYTNTTGQVIGQYVDGTWNELSN